jgi:type IV pilus assembly protein PilE
LETLSIKSEEKFMLYRNKLNGFSLVELMIVIVIIGILAAIGIPNYQDHMRRAARSAGQSYLADLAQAQELRFQNSRVYSNLMADFQQKHPMPSDIATRYAAPVVVTVDPAAGTLGFYSFTMAPLAGPQAVDGTLYIDSTGLRERIVGAVHNKWN